MEKDKVSALFGFAVKAGKLIYGKDNISVYGKKLHLIAVCPTLSQNSYSDIEYIAKSRKIPIIIPAEPLEKILFKIGCKAAALKDKQMSEAIIQNTNGNYRLIKFAEETI